MEIRKEKNNTQINVHTGIQAIKSFVQIFNLINVEKHL